MAANNAHFLVKTHVFEGQHIRHYPGATRNGDNDIQYLEAKQYIPLNNQTPQDGNVTILAAHATAFPKELYEPLWEDLLAQSQCLGFRIRSIWIADTSNQGASSVLNERTMGDDPSWSDYARDLLHMTNVFRKDMVQPIVGLGHSIGGTTLVHLSLIHPRLFASLVLVDPILSGGNQDMGPTLFYMAATRPDLFPSREVAKKVFQRAFKNWDGRAFDRWMQYGLRDTPTAVYPEAGKITLRTTKANESWNVGRSQFDDLAADGSLSKSARLKYHDADPVYHPFYQAAIPESLDALTKLLPDVLYILPQKTMVSKQTQETTLASIGTARGGSGGFHEGRAAMLTVPGTSHLCVFEKPAECACEIAKWLERDLKEVKMRNDFVSQNRDDKSDADKLRLSPEWIRRVEKLFEETRSSNGKWKL